MIPSVFAVSGLDAYQVAFSLKTAGLQSERATVCE
jgi:hypothetical protein